MYRFGRNLLGAAWCHVFWLVAAFVMFGVYAGGALAQTCAAGSFATVGNTSIVPTNVIQLTPASNNQLGAAWSNNRIDLTLPFDYTANVKLGSNDVNGADGLTFVLQTSGTGAIGQPGRGIGAGSGLTGITYADNGIKPSFIVEIDTYGNADNGWNDPVADHVAAYINGDPRHQANANNIISPVAIANIEDGAFHPFRLVWDPTTNLLQIYLNGSLVTSTTYDLQAYFGTNLVYWGYTASTGGFNNLHQICPLSALPDAPADLVTVKTRTSAATATVGQNVTFDIVVTNNGPSIATGVNLTDQLPSGLTFFSASATQGSYVSGTGVWTVGSLASGSTATLTLTGTVNATAGSGITAASTNTTTAATGSQTDPTTAGDLLTASVSVTTSSDLAIAKSVSNATPNVGSNVIFTLTATNNGPSNSTGVTVSDLLPAGYTYVSHSGPGSYNPGTGDWAIGSLNSGATAVLNVTATVLATGPYANTASITGPNPDPTPGNNSSTVTPVPVPLTDLVMSKSVNNATPNVGTNVIFTLGVTNNGPSAATGVSVADLLPAGYTYVSDTSGGAYNSGTGVWTVGALANGASASITVTATVNATGSYVNSATVTGGQTDPTPGNNTATSTPVPVPLTDLVMAKSVNNATPNVGSNVIFTLTVTNNGPSAATGVSVNDLLPAGYTHVSNTGGGAYNVGTGVWTIGGLANGASTSITITATVNATGSYVNTATVTGAQTDPTPGNNSATATPVPVELTDLAITKSAGNATPNVGSSMIFTLTVTNNGPSAATGVTVSDLLPAGYTYVSHSGPGSYNPGTGAWAIGNLASGASNVLNITVIINTTGPYANTATVTGAQTDPTPGNNTSTSTPVPVQVVDLFQFKSVSNATPNVGSNVTFTLTVGNAGPSDATGVVVTDLLPAGYTYVSDTSGVAYNPGTGVWTVGALAGGFTITSIDIVATVNASGPYLNTASATSTETELNPADNTESVTTTPVAQADLVMAKSVSNATPNVGSNVTFTLTVTNNGPSNATGVTATDLLPAGYTYVSDTSGGAYNSGTGLWTIGALANGASTSINVTATVRASGSYANTATVTGGQGDPVPGNNNSTSTPVPVPVTDLSVVKSVSNATPNVGSNVTFTLTVTNNGPSNATGVSVTDLLPSGYTYVSDNAGGAYNSGTGLWTIGALANGASTSLGIVATVNASGTYANTATVTGTQTDPTPANNTSTSTPTPSSVADLAITKSVDNSLPIVGDTITFTLNVINNGPSDATSVIVNDPMPAGYNYVSDTSCGAYNAGTGVWTIGNLANGATATLDITVTIGVGGPYLNTATISGAQTDPSPANNTASVAPGPLPRADLFITKTVSNATPNVGSNVTFTLTVGNNGLSTGTGVSVSDLLPTGYTYVSDTSGGAYNPGTGVWTIGNLAATAFATIDITATVNPTGNYTNSSTVTGNEADPNFANNTSAVTPVPVAQADLAMAKSVSNGTPNVGSNVTFTLDVTNNGPSAATGVSVSDLLPAGYSYVSHSGPGSYNSGTGAWSIGGLASGGTATLSVVATVNATGPYLNTATVSATQSDPVPGNNTSSVTTVPVAQADVAIVKSVSSATPNVGSNVTFTLTATNNGPSAATGTSVNDLLPAGYTYVSDTSGGAYNAGTGVWTIGNLANGASSAISITATVNAAGPYANTATITSTVADPTPGNNTSTVTPVPVPVADLVMVKTVDNPSPNVGDTITFTLSVTNAGPSAATGVTVNDTWPAGLTYVSDTSGGAYNSGTGIWTVGNLANGASASFTITATVGLTGPYDNTATATGNETDPNPGDNSATAIVSTAPAADLSVFKAIDNPTPAVGSTVTFSIFVNNLGPLPATGVTMTDLLPAGYTYVSDSSGGAYNPATGVWFIGNQVPGATYNIDIVATVNATGPYANTVSVLGNEFDPNPANNDASVTAVPTSVADLAVVKTVSNPAPNVGSTITFTLTASNNGPSAATGVTVSDPLPAGYTYVSDTSGGAYNAGTGAWTIGNLANGATTAIDITVTVNASGSYVNTATASGNETDPTPGNNSSTITPAPVAQADLAVTKVASNATPNVGSTVTFTLTVTNNGPSAATNVSVTDVLPTGYTYVSDTSGGTYNIAGTGLWSIGNLASGATATMDITVTVNASGIYLNSASVTGTEPDPNLANNTATSTPAPVAQADLAMVKSVNIANPNVGTNVIFTLTVTNNGPSDATAVVVSDPLPTGYTYVSDSSGGAYNAGTGDWTIGAMANGASSSITVTATVNPVGVYANTATATATETDPNPGNNASTATPTPNAVADLALTKTVDNAAPAVGSNVTFTITVTNNGPSSATGVVVSEPLATGYTYVSDTSGGAYNAATGLWTIGNMANGATVSLDVTVTVNAAGNYTNTATASGAGIDPIVPNNAGTVVPVPFGSGALTVTKTAAIGTVMVGQVVPYTITLTNASPGTAVQTSVVDVMPPGFVYQSGSGSVGGVAQNPTVNGSRLTFASVLVPPASTVTITVNAFVSSSAQAGPQTNRVRAVDPVTGAGLAPDARATVMVMVDPVFDCGTVIGKVFDDVNLDGYQNPGEHGIPGVRVVGVRGTIITTDRHGRFHVPCADLPRDIGSNFLLKLDTRSLPTGYRITTENPRVVRLTAGKMTELNFGASISRLVRVDLSAKAFLTGEDALKPREELVKAIGQMVEQIKDSPSVLRLSYVLDGDSRKLARDRTKAVEEVIRDLWPDRGRYRLIVERTVRANAQSPEEE